MQRFDDQTVLVTGGTGGQGSSHVRAFHAEGANVVIGDIDAEIAAATAASIGARVEWVPGGEAQLFVGADPAGQARLGVVAPEEPFTLPLGIDPAVRPVRNVRLVTREKGLLDKQDVTEYRVTLEVANPYAFPLALRLHEQWPLSRDQNVEVKLLRTEPSAERDEDKGTLLWRVSVPPSQKLTVSFVYSVRAPKGWGLAQNQ